MSLREGWQDLQHNDGPNWNYLGICLGCQAEERAETLIPRKMGKQGRLLH